MRCKTSGRSLPIRLLAGLRALTPMLPGLEQRDGTHLREPRGSLTTTPQVGLNVGWAERWAERRLG
jgi:hypothetical protein